MQSAFRLAVLIAALPVVATAAALISGGGDVPQAPAGFTIAKIARLSNVRELVATPDGDLIAGTSGSSVYVVPNAGDGAGTPRVFATFPDRGAAGVALGKGALFVGTTHGVWRLPFQTGDRSARSAPERIARVRDAVDGAHTTTSVAVAGHTLFASVGSSCNACDESDSVRATIQQLAFDGGDRHAKAVRMRNAIALATDPATGALWAGVAGQDELEHGHPYEIFDDVSAHAGPADYGWPQCFENRRPARPDANCANVAVPRVVFPAYETPIGAVFYPEHAVGAHAFPAAYRGGAFVTLHGSWHQPPVPPRVVFVPLHGDDPLHPVDWNDPDAQWTAFLTGYQRADGSRIGRPTGVAVGPDGSLFVADDLAGVIYRIRPKE